MRNIYLLALRRLRRESEAGISDISTRKIARLTKAILNVPSNRPIFVTEDEFYLIEEAVAESAESGHLEAIERGGKKTPFLRPATFEPASSGEEPYLLDIDGDYIKPMRRALRSKMSDTDMLDYKGWKRLVTGSKDYDLLGR